MVRSLLVYAMWSLFPWCWVRAVSVCQIRPLSTPSCVSRTLPIPQMSGRMRDAFTCSSLQMGTSTVHEILTFITRLISFCLQSLHHRLVDWTKPSNAPLILGTLIDLARSRSDLLAENALLRKPLMILRRHMKRPVCTKTVCWLLGTSVQKTGGKEWKKIGIVSTRVNGQFSISSCLILLASQMGREDKVSLKSLFLNGCPE
jgi:hypothetical protein